MKMTFKQHLQNLSDAVDELVAERDAWRRAVKENQPPPDNESGDGGRLMTKPAHRRGAIH